MNSSSPTSDQLVSLKFPPSSAALTSPLCLQAGIHLLSGRETQTSDAGLPKKRVQTGVGVLRVLTPSPLGTRPGQAGAQHCAASESNSNVIIFYVTSMWEIGESTDLPSVPFCPHRLKLGSMVRFISAESSAAVQLASRMAVKILRDMEVPERRNPGALLTGLRRCDEKGSLGGHLGRSLCSFRWDGASHTLQGTSSPAVPVENADPGPLLPHQNTQAVCLQADPLGRIFFGSG